VLLADMLATLKIGDGRGYLEDAMDVCRLTEARDYSLPSFNLPFQYLRYALY
jgi:hypothetical protein